MEQQHLAAKQENDGQLYDLRHGFSLGGYQLLLKKHTHAEVIKSARVCTIPDTPEWFLGFINHRGEAVPVYDLARYLGITEEVASKDRCILLLDRQPDTVAIQLQEMPQGVIDPQVLSLDEQLAVPAQLAEFCSEQYRCQDETWLELEHQGFFIEQMQQFNKTEAGNPA